MHEKNIDAEYQKKYKSVLKQFAEMAANDPDMIPELRRVLKISAASMLSNRPDTILEFQKLGEEIDSFLSACQIGEIDPHTFIQSFEDQNKQDAE
ncbi:hypothetical protein [Desulfobacter sp.]